MDASQGHTQPSALARWRGPLAAAGVLLLLVALLLLDLTNRGLVWRFFWSQTGEETVAGQLRGMVELGGNLIRPLPQTQPLAPIQHADSVPYGINTFLNLEVEEEKLRAMLAMIREAGFRWLRQEFPWEDIEVDGRGQFTDSRNDLDGDGQPDTVDAWAKYDRIVDLVEAYDLQLIVRLSNPPAWSRAENPPTAGGSLAPPDDLEDFVNYAVAVAERYRGRITHYQIWNEPNIYPEWGEQFADPAAYTEMLCRTYEALKQVDPEIVVLSAAIAPTISLDGYQGYQDLIYLQNMYDHGAGACFDILSAQAYGLFSGPTDRRRRLTTVNSARHVYYRDLMVANGDAHKPIWISEMAWNAVASAGLLPEQIADYDRYGVTTLEEAARYAPLFYQRAREEWPWIGSISYWFFTLPDDSRRGESMYYFRMAEPDYSPEDPTFTPLPVYHAMRAYIQDTPPVLYRGTHQAEDWAVRLVDDGHLTAADGAVFGEAVRTTGLSFTAHGTHVRLRYRAPEGLTLTRDGGADLRLPPAADWHEVTVTARTLPASQAYTLRADTPFEAPFEMDTIVVMDRMWSHVGPALAAGLILGVLAAGMLARAAWRRVAARLSPDSHERGTL